MKRILILLICLLVNSALFAASIQNDDSCTSIGCGTAYPICINNTFNIIYDAGGGAGDAPMTPVSCDYGEECLAPENTYTRDNYTFLYWTCKKSDNTDCEQSTYYTGDSISTATTTDNDTITLTANWMIDGFYSIKYNMFGGALSAELSGSRTDSCNQESDLIELPTLTRANSRFEGWYTDSKFATKITEIKTGECSGDMELYAKWSCDNGYKSSEAGDACTEINYAITYNLNGGTNTSRNPETYKITDNTIILVHPTRANSTFDGWYADAEFTTKIESIDSGSTGDRAVYAKWSCNDGYAMSADGLSCIGNTITIVYNTDGGTAVESTTCTYGEKFTITSTTSKTGYTFSGWKFVGNNIVKDTTTEVMCDDSLLGIYEGSYTTVAQWTANNYNVTYYCVDDSTIANKEENVDFDSEYTVAQSSCEKVGYTFAGWAVSDTETVVNPDDKFVWNYTEDKTLTAQWTLNSYECVAGQYLPVGATECATCMAGSYCVGGTYNYDTTKAQGISDCPADFREGGTGLESEGACMGSCTASCEPKTCPSHSTNCVHGSETATGTMTYGNQSCSATAPVCSMTFDCVDGYNKSGDGCVAGNMNTITYNTDGGKINGSKIESCNVESGDIVLPTDVTKTGYTFAGWYDANGAKLETIASGSCVIPITLTARWTLNSYECSAGQYLPVGATECATCMAGSYCVGSTYNYDTTKAQGISDCPADFREGGTGLESEGACIGSCTVECEPKTCPEHSTNCVHATETATGTMTYGNQSCSATAPVCSMTFECESGYNKAGDSCVAGDMNTITYDEAGGKINGSKVDSCNVESGDIVLPTDVTKTGYTFAGWYDANGAKLETIASGSCISPITLTAQWTLNSYECSAGQYLPVGATECEVCPAGSYCVGSTYNYDTTKAQGISDCPVGYTDGGAGLTSEGACIGSCTVECEQKTCPSHSTNCVHGTKTESGTMTYGEQQCSATAPVCSMTFECESGYNKAGDRCVAGDMNTITYNTNDGKINGSKVESCNVESGDIVLPTDVTKTGYTFAGWYDANGDKVETIASGSCVIPITLTARWTLNSYDCAAGQYLPAGATECVVCPAGLYCVGSTYNYDTTKAQGISDCPSGYTDGGAGLTSEGACIGSCTVECEQKTCPSHSTNCVHGTKTESGTMTYGEQQCSATAPVCSMTFECVDGYEQRGEQCVLKGDSTITYELNGGEVVDTLVKSCNAESETIVLPTNASKTDHTFDGWYDATGNQVTEISATDCAKSEPITLTAQWTACSVCNAGTGATCELSVVNNQCVYTTGCADGYYKEQGTGTTTPVCENCLKSCSGNGNEFTLGEYNVCKGETDALCYRECETGDVSSAYAVSGTVNAGGTNACVATSCVSDNYLSNGTCVACDSGFNAPNNNTSGISSCTSDCEKACSGYAECPQNATCEYDTTYKTVGTQTQVGECAASSVLCPVSSFVCADGYSKTANGCSVANLKVIYNLNGGTNYAGAPNNFAMEYGVRIDGVPLYSGFAFGGWCTDAGLTQCFSAIEVLPNTATGDLHVWAKWSACPSGYYCDGDKHQCPETYPESAPQSDELSDCYQICETVMVDAVSIKEPLNAIEYYGKECSYGEKICRSGYEIINGRCDKCVRDNALTYGHDCKIESCVSGYHLNEDKCEANIIDCVDSVKNAESAQREWNRVNHKYDECTVLSCVNGYHIESNTCVPDTRTCSISNGVGEQWWNERTGTWDKCVAMSCDPGYIMGGVEEQCVPCDNMYDVNGKLAASSYVRECEIASCLYQGELYALENNECRLICEEYSDETGRRYWNDITKKCVHDCETGYMNW